MHVHIALSENGLWANYRTLVIVSILHL